MGQGASAMTRTGWEPTAKTRTDLGSCRLGNSHLSSGHLEKYPWEVAAWENAFGKIPKSLKS